MRRRGSVGASAGPLALGHTESMGKRNGRRGAPQTRRRTAPPAPPRLRLTAAVTPTEALAADIQLRLEREVGLLRAGLLYTDDLELISPTAELLLDVMSRRDYEALDLARWIGDLKPATRRYLGVDEMTEPALKLLREHSRQKDPDAWLNEREKAWLASAETPADAAGVRQAVAQIRRYSDPVFTKPYFD